MSGLTILNMIDAIRIITDHINAIAPRFFHPIIQRQLSYHYPIRSCITAYFISQTSFSPAAVSATHIAYDVKA